VSPRQEVTKLLSLTLKEFAIFRDEDVRDGVFTLIDALDTDLEALEYGQSDEVTDKMALLFAANGDARELADEPTVPTKVVSEEKEEDELPDDEEEEEDEDKEIDKELEEDE